MNRRLPGALMLAGLKLGHPAASAKTLLGSLPVYHILIAEGLIQPQATVDLKQSYKCVFSSRPIGPQKAFYS